MIHLLMLPVLLPAFTAAVLLLGARMDPATQRAVGILSTMALVGVSVALLVEAAGGGFQVYRLGNWDAPFGIVLVLDRLSALMVLLTSIVGIAAILHAVQGWDARGRNFHALFQFQLMGLNGAFLTGDIFNLFVFFEILLIASYGLVLHGGGARRVGAGIHYVVLNLVASAFFVIALGVVYGTLGTLNMADLAVKVAAAGPDQEAILRAGALLLLVVFSVKAALLPLYFWLPRAYGAASAPVAALFAIMTKVGVYAILRVYTLIFPGSAPVMDGLPGRILFPLALVTLAVAMIGAVGARDLRNLVSYLVVASVGTLLAAFGLFSAEAVGAGLYYLIHSTIIVAALFLLVELIAKQRGVSEDQLAPATPVAQPTALGSLFFLAAMAIAGLPPLSGFLGKTFILRSGLDAPGAGWLFGVILGGGLLSLVAVGRAGSVVFWRTDGESDANPHSVPAFAPVIFLLVLVIGLSAFAEPIAGYTEEAAAQLMNSDGYIRSVLGEPGGAP